MKIDLDGAWVTRGVIGVGITQYTAFSPFHVSPLGFVWGHHFGGDKATFNTLHSYVLPWFRRNGVRTLIEKEILEKAEVIITGGSSEEGQAFMKARGYHYDARLDQWSFVRSAENGGRS